ncbi:MAG: hypothetical protein HKP07_04605, partial [Flavobacteriaceae bacterium]|nr:hypothetical protein [Flavobacteriaceae bacterium]
MRIILIALLLFITTLCFSQTKVSGIVVDDNGDPVAFANVIFPNSTEGTITNDNGRFYLESDQNYNVIQVSF